MFAEQRNFRQIITPSLYCMSAKRTVSNSARKLSENGLVFFFITKERTGSFAWQRGKQKSERKSFFMGTCNKISPLPPVNKNYCRVTWRVCRSTFAAGFTCRLFFSGNLKSSIWPQAQYMLKYLLLLKIVFIYFSWHVINSKRLLLVVKENNTMCMVIVWYAFVNTEGFIFI